MSVESIQRAAWEAWRKLDRFQTLDAGVKREMCDSLRCDPHELEGALTDAVIEAILCG